MSDKTQIILKQKWTFFGLIFFALSCQNEAEISQPTEIAEPESVGPSELTGDWIVDSIVQVNYEVRGGLGQMQEGDIWSFGEYGSFAINHETGIPSSYVHRENVVVIESMGTSSDYQIISVDDQHLHLSYAGPSLLWEDASTETYLSRIKN